MEIVAEKCSLNMTGADFYALCSDAMLNAMSRTVALINKGIHLKLHNFMSVPTTRTSCFSSRHINSHISNFSMKYCQVNSKLTERIVKSCLADYLSTNNLLNSFQSAYIKHHSTETTLLFVQI